VGAVPLSGDGERGSWVPILHNVTEADAYLNAKLHLDPSNRLAIHQRHRQTGQTGQPDNGSIAYGEPFYKRSPKIVKAKRSKI